jgi:hypothetical protein
MTASSILLQTHEIRGAQAISFRENCGELIFAWQKGQKSVFVDFLK